LRFGGGDLRRQHTGAVAGTGGECALFGLALPLGDLGEPCALGPRLARHRPRELGAIDLLEELCLHRLEVLTCSRPAGDGLADRPLMLIEQRRLERCRNRALVGDIVERPLLHAAAPPGVSRRDMHLRPAPGELALQADLGQVVFAQRMNDLRPRDQRFAAPALGGVDFERTDRGPVAPAHGNPRQRRHRHADRGREPRERVCAARLRLLLPLAGTGQLQLVGQQLRAGDVADLETRAVTVEQRLACGAE
jgi:hypothetical protein